MKVTVIGYQYPYVTIVCLNHESVVQTFITERTELDEGLVQRIKNTEGTIIFDNNDAALLHFLREHFEERLFSYKLYHRQVKGVVIVSSAFKDVPYNFEATESLKQASLLANYMIMKAKQLI